MTPHQLLRRAYRTIENVRDSLPTDKEARGFCTDALGHLQSALQVIDNPEGKPITDAYRVKEYACADCGHVTQIGTNHYGDCYSVGRLNHCPNCSPSQVTVWKCQEPCPTHMALPKPWRVVKLGDVIKIK